MNIDEIYNLYAELRARGETPKEIIASLINKGYLPNQVLNALNAKASAARSEEEAEKVCRDRDELLKELSRHS